jgi:hypothetical protein
MVFARHLDGAFIGLGAGIREEHLIGEGCLDEALGQPLATRDAHEVRDVPDLLGLLDQRRHEMGMRISERIDRDAAAEIEISFASVVVKPRTLASLEGEVRPRECRQKR